MPNCTDIGLPGNEGFTFKEMHSLHKGTICVLTGYVQGALKQTVTVRNSKGEIVAEIQGQQGGAGIPGVMTPTAGQKNYFNPDGGHYKITFANNGAQISRVLYTNSSAAVGPKTYLQTWTFITEDTPNGGDCDFNDTTAFLSWNLKVG